MASPLATKIRAKFPGAYDDMDDAALEKSVLAKHPEYSDLATPEPPKGDTYTGPDTFIGGAAQSLAKTAVDTGKGILSGLATTLDPRTYINAQAAGAEENRAEGQRVLEHRPANPNDVGMAGLKTAAKSIPDITDPTTGGQAIGGLLPILAAGPTLGAATDAARAVGSPQGRVIAGRTLRMVSDFDMTHPFRSSVGRVADALERSGESSAASAGSPHATGSTTWFPERPAPVEQGPTGPHMDLSERIPAGSLTQQQLRERFAAVNANGGLEAPTHVEAPRPTVGQLRMAQEAPQAATAAPQQAPVAPEAPSQPALHVDQASLPEAWKAVSEQPSPLQQPQSGISAYRGAKGTNQEWQSPTYFTTSIDEANTYAGVRNPVTGADAPGRAGSQVQPVSLSIQNPKTVSFAEIANATQETLARAAAEGFDGLRYSHKGKEWYVPLENKQIRSRFTPPPAAEPPPMQQPRVDIGAEKVGRGAGLTKEQVRQQTAPILGEAQGEASPILPERALQRIIDTLKDLPKGGPEREAYVARATSGKTQWQVENIRRTLEHLGLIVPIAASVPSVRDLVMQRLSLAKD